MILYVEKKKKVMDEIKKQPGHAFQNMSQDIRPDSPLWPPPRAMSSFCLKNIFLCCVGNVATTLSHSPGTLPKARTPNYTT